MTASEAPPESDATTSPVAGGHRRALLVNTVVAAFVGATAMIMVHEAIHLFVGLALGHPSTMYAFGVDHAGSPSPVAGATMALSAPVFSLVSGLALSLWLPFRRHGGFRHLVWLFFAFSSIQEGVAYLVITPFGAGDTGSAMRMLGAPFWVSMLLCLVGVGGMFGSARLFAPHLARHAGEGQPERNAFSLFPWLYGSVILTAATFLYLGLAPMDPSALDQIAIVSANTVILVFAPMANIFRKSAAVAGVAHEPLTLSPIPVAGLIAAAFLVAINVALCVVGLSLG